MNESDFAYEASNVAAMTRRFPRRLAKRLAARPDRHMDYSTHSHFCEQAWDEGGH